jgi:hypothetical protein
MTNNRQFQRIHFHCKVEFETGNTQQVCELLDISFRGALIDVGDTDTYQAGATCRLTLTLDEASDVKIIMDGSIAHQIDNRVGIHCQSIDLDSMTHLRRLLELNLGDDQLLHRELEALIPGDEA